MAAVDAHADIAAADAATAAADPEAQTPVPRPPLMLPPSALSAAHGLEVRFGDYKGCTFEYVRDDAGREWVLWFLAHDTMSNSYLRRYLLYYFTVVHRGPYDILIDRATGETIIQSLHLSENSGPPEGVLRLDGPAPPAQDNRRLGRKRPRSPSRPPTAVTTTELLDYNQYMAASAAAAGQSGPGNEPRYCRYWMKGRGCKKLLTRNCSDEHPDYKDGVDYVERNMCRKHVWGRCRDPSGCCKIHATSASDARAVFAGIVTTTASTTNHAVTETVPVVTPFAQAILTAVLASPSHERDLFVQNVCGLLRDSFLLQHPAIRAHIDVVISNVVQCMNSTDSSTGGTAWHTAQR
jgi:hypothetical protein